MQKRQKAMQKTMQNRKQKHAEGPEQKDQKDHKRPLTGPVWTVGRVRAWSARFRGSGFGDPCGRAVNPCGILHAVPDMLSSCFSVPLISDYMLPSSCHAVKLPCNYQESTIQCRAAVLIYNFLLCRQKAIQKACIVFSWYNNPALDNPRYFTGTIHYQGTSYAAADTLSCERIKATTAGNNGSFSA